jgi:hypothetical protein
VSRMKVKGQAGRERDVLWMCTALYTNTLESSYITILILQYFILMCDAPCIFVYFTNVWTIISLLYVPRLHVSTCSVIIRAFKIYQRF